MLLGKRQLDEENAFRNGANDQSPGKRQMFERGTCTCVGGCTNLGHDSSHIGCSTATKSTCNLTVEYPFAELLVLHVV